jgi:hypothetical protein
MESDQVQLPVEAEGDAGELMHRLVTLRQVATQARKKAAAEAAVAEAAATEAAATVR